MFYDISVFVGQQCLCDILIKCIGLLDLINEILHDDSEVTDMPYRTNIVDIVNTIFPLLLSFAVVAVTVAIN